MNKELPNSLPFPTREMLTFGKEAKLELIIRTFTDLNRTLSLRGVTRNGIIDIPHTNAGDSQGTETIAPIDDFPIWLSLAFLSTNTLHGLVYARVSLRINETAVFPLMAGFVNQQESVTWPNATIESTMPGRGAIARIDSANPAAGAEATITIPAGETWRIIQAGVTLVTDANAADRRVHLDFQGSNGMNLSFFSSVQHTASLTRIYGFSAVGVIPDEEDDTNIIVALPHELWLQAENVITTDTVNIQVGDDFGILSVIAEKFFSGA